MRKFAFLILLLFVSYEVSAQTATLQTQAPTMRTHWSGFASMGYSSNLYERNQYSSQAYGTADVLLNYRVAGENLIRTFMSGYQEQNSGQESKLNDGYIGWVNNGFWSRGKILTIGQSVRAIIPASKDSYKRDEKLTGITVAPSFVFNLTPIKLTGVTLIYQPQFTRNFHKYEQNRVFQNNAQYSINQSLAVTWSITDHVYIQPSFVYGMGWSYKGYKRDDNYQFAALVGYAFNNGIMSSVGVTNAGAIRNFENGNDQTIQLFNNKTASVFTDLTYVF